jgi:alanine dehydrogenase
MPYVVQLANDGVVRAVQDNPGLKHGVNVVAGKVTYAPVADAVGVPFVPVDEALGSLRAV